jgi:hypothetical protein
MPRGVTRRAIAKVVHNDAGREKLAAASRVFMTHLERSRFQHQLRVRRLIRKVRRLFRRKPRYRPFSEAFDDFNRRWRHADVDIDPDEVFRDVRSRDPGRDFNF